MRDRMVENVMLGQTTDIGNLLVSLQDFLFVLWTYGNGKSPHIWAGKHICEQSTRDKDVFLASVEICAFKSNSILRTATQLFKRKIVVFCVPESPVVRCYSIGTHPFQRCHVCPGLFLWCGSSAGFLIGGWWAVSVTSASHPGSMPLPHPLLDVSLQNVVGLEST